MSLFSLTRGQVGILVLSAIALAVMVGMKLHQNRRLETVERIANEQTAAEEQKARKAQAAKAKAQRQRAAEARSKKQGGTKVVARRRVITPAESLKTAAGFRLELVRAAEPDEGSWICMTKDDRGRLIISGQPEQGIFRATLKDGAVTKWEKLGTPLTGAMGMLYAYDSLYLSACDRDGYGLFRVRDTDGDDEFDFCERLTKFEGSGDEHGPHALQLGPDGKIYCIVGDRTNVVEGISPASPHRNHQADVLAVSEPGRESESRGAHYPGGYVVRTDAEGKEWELVLGGLRNAYDFAFNADGEMLTVDSDMEWDWGMPWYRPTRVLHATSGSEFGCRPLDGKWPAYYEDSLPAVVDIGLSSPTGVATGAGTKFPAAYQRAMYFLDWTYGRVMAVHLQPTGSSYQATTETFIAPKDMDSDEAKQPFNLTDVVIGDDGAMYLIVGGRNARGALYRVTYDGSEPTGEVELANSEGRDARATRQQMEHLHGRVDLAAISEIWKHLGSDDRYLRFAARVALESQPVESWRVRALEEQEPTVAISALLALTRVGSTEDQQAVQEHLAAMPLAKLTSDEQRMLLRTWSVSLARHGDQASAEIKQELTEQLDQLVPTADETLNREGMRLLVHLQAPSAASKGLALIAAARTQQEQIFHLLQLRALPSANWTPEQRREFLTLFGQERPKLPSDPQLVGWFENVGRKYTDGSSFYEFMTNYFWEAVDHLSPAEREQFAETIEHVNATILPPFETPSGISVVKNWSVNELQTLADDASHGRNFGRGRRSFIFAQCIQCHRFDGSGGVSGPDLTTISRRFSRQQILESIVEPSKVVSDQYEHVLVATVDGRVITGRLLAETSEKLVIRPNPLRPERVEILKSEIEERGKSKFSPMPEHLVDVLRKEEILDLLAYLESGGNENYVAFRKDSEPSPAATVATEIE